MTVFNRQAGSTDIRLLDLTRGGQASAVTSDVTFDLTPVFSPDSQQLAFASARRGTAHVVVKHLTDPGKGEELVPPSGAVQFVSDWADSVDGQLLLHNDFGPNDGDGHHGGRSDRRETHQGARQDHRRIEMDGHISPDGKWLAYASTLTGRSEVYVRSLQTGQQWPVSSTGGVSPRWRR